MTFSQIIAKRRNIKFGFKPEQSYVNNAQSDLHNVNEHKFVRFLFDSRQNWLIRKQYRVSLSGKQTFMSLT